MIGGVMMNLFVLNKDKVKLEKDCRTEAKSFKVSFDGVEGGLLLLSYSLKERDSFEKEVKSLLDKFEIPSNRLMDSCTIFSLAMRWVVEYRKYLGLSKHMPCNSSDMTKIFDIVLNKLKEESFDEDNSNYSGNDFVDCYFKLINTIVDFDKFGRLHRLPSDCYVDFVNKGFSVKTVRKTLFIYKSFKSLKEQYDMYDLLIYFNKLLSDNEDCRKRFSRRYSLIVADYMSGFNPSMVSCISPILDKCLIFDYEGNRLKI